MKPLRNILLAWTLTAGTLATGFAADLSHTIQNLQLTNYTGYVVDADANTLDPARNREHLLVESRVRTENTSGFLLINSYQLRYRLLDSAGQPHPLYDATGLVSPDDTYNLTNGFGISPMSVVTLTNVAMLRPAAPLDPAETYTVELNLHTDNIRPLDTATDGPYTFYHFTNLVSNDPGLNVIATVNQAEFSRAYAVTTDPDRDRFQAEVSYTLRRYDNFNGTHDPQDTVPVILRYELVNAATEEVIPLVFNELAFNRQVFKYDPPPPSNPIVPVVVNGIRVVDVQPAPGTQLDSVNEQYRLDVTIHHLEVAGDPGSEVTGTSGSSTDTRLLHFNGTLWFGSLESTFASIDNHPATVSVVGGSHVNTVLSVDDQTGTVPSIPGITYGDGTDLDVRLLANGDAELDGGMAPVDLPPDTTAKINNVRMDLLEPASLTPDGLFATLRVHLPTGLGYRSDTLGHFLRRYFLVTAVPLGSDLAPQENVLFDPAAAVFVSEESKPLWLQTDSILWVVAEGRFELNVVETGARHVRTDEYDYLESVHAVLENSDRSLKRSNDRYYDAVQSVATPAHVLADAACAARLSLDLALGAGDYRAHFPHDTLIQWSGAGSLQIEQDLVVSANSQLDGAGQVALNYGTGCEGVDCGEDATVNLIRLTPDDGVLRFTRDGGLVGGGALPVPHQLQWGFIASLDDFAHQAFTFTEGTFHMPGHAMRGDQTGWPLIHRAAAMLYTGVAATNTAYLERPDLPGTQNQTRYEIGHADYAGINLAVGQDSARQAESVLAGSSSGIYQLKGISKYYARRGGVTGIHDSVPGSFPPSMTLYGYDFNFDNFGLNFLDNRMHESLISGFIDVPHPSDFEQDFASLVINCLGGIEGDARPGISEDKNLAYWNGSFDAMSWHFQHVPDDICNVSEAYLVMAVETRIAHVPETLYGNLGFMPDGNLIPRSLGPEDVDSRLKLPNVIHVAGPDEEEYILNPVADVYFNHYDEINEANTPVGWVNIAATMDVPFFEDLRVHVHTSANPGSEDALLHLMGGWPDHGWESMPGVNYFTAEYFDDLNRGYAQAPMITPENYRDFDGENYHPRATRTWLKVIPFDYPMNWNSATRSFRSQQPKINKLMVLSTENELKYLSAENAEIAFGAQFDGLPTVNLANLAVDALDAVTGFSDTLTDYLTDMLAGFDRLNQILSADLDPYFNGVFDQTLQPRIDQLVADLQQAYEVSPATWQDDAGDLVEAAFLTGPDTIEDRLLNLVGNTPVDAGLMQQLDGYLAQAQTAMDGILAIVEEDMGGNRHVASELMLLLVDHVAAQFAAGFVDEIVQPLLAEADPTLDQITETLQNLSDALAQLRSTLANPAGMGNELKQLFLDHAPEINVAMPDMMAGIGDFVLDIDLALDSPLEDFTPDEFGDLIRQEVEDRFYGTDLAAAIQVVNRQRLYDPDAAIRQAVDTAFQQLNDVIRSVISETAEELTGQFTQFLDSLEDKAAAAKVNGYAHINGDSLKEARVDLHAKLDLGTPLELNVYLQIKELDSMGSAGCDYGGEDSITEVSMGAEDVQVGWISPELRISLNTKFTFSEIGNGFPLRGMGGGFEMTGELDYEAFAINFLGAQIAFGQEENFISAAAGMRINKYDVFGGIFFGRACSIDPIRLWDPEAAALLGDGVFTGIYGYGEGWIPVNELIGIPASCMFNICAGMGMGAGVFLEGPTFLAKMTAGVSGEALCLIGIKGELVGTGVLEGIDLNVVDGLTVKAKGTLSGEIGFCPFCLSHEVSVGLIFKQGKWKIEL